MKERGYRVLATRLPIPARGGIDSQKKRLGVNSSETGLTPMCLRPGARVRVHVGGQRANKAVNRCLAKTCY